MTPDVNVLVAGSRLDHPHNGPALAWLDAALKDCEKGRGDLSDGCGGVSASGHPPEGVCSADATRRPLTFLRAVLNSPGVEMPRLGNEWFVFERLCEHHRLTGNDIPDAWIAAAVRPITISW